jgi:DNA mismatch repair protein MutS2
VRLLNWGTEAEVVSVTERSVMVRSAGVNIRVEPSEIKKIGGPTPSRTPQRVPPRIPPPASKEPGVRVGANTLDLRGARVDEATTLVSKFFSDALIAGFDSVFLLHGHGTGALKRGLRAWLSGVEIVHSHSPAEPLQGGDAVTVVHLR